MSVKFYPFLSKCNDAVIFEKTMKDILKSFLFSANKVTVAACRMSVVTFYLLTPQKKKKLLALSTYPDCTDCILCYLTLLFDGGDNLILYVRFVLFVIFLFCSLFQVLSKRLQCESTKSH